MKIDVYAKVALTGALINILLVSVVACSVADADDELPSALRNLPSGWQEGEAFDFDVLKKAVYYKLTRQQIKKLFGRAPDKTSTGTGCWYYFGDYLDEVTERSFNCYYVDIHEGKATTNGFLNKKRN